MRRAIKSIIKKKKKPLSAVYRTKLCYFLGEHKNVPLETFYCRSMSCSSSYLLLLLYFQHAPRKAKEIPGSFDVAAVFRSCSGLVCFLLLFFFFRRSRRCECVVAHKQDGGCQNEPAFNSAVDHFWLRPCHPQGPHYRLWSQQRGDEWRRCQAANSLWRPYLLQALF